MKRINPVVLLIIFSLVVFLVRKFFYPDYTDEMVIGAMESFLATLGPLGFLYILAAFGVSAFFFIPVLMPLCILCGAFYGPVEGAVVALAGITLSSMASTFSVRRVFRGMGGVVMNNPDYKSLLVQMTRYGVVVVLLVRLAFVVPYILQNILLAMTNISNFRLAGLTLIGAIPGVMSYSFLGAGLVNLDNANLWGLFVLIPVILVYLVNGIITRLRRKYGADAENDFPS